MGIKLIKSWLLALAIAITPTACFDPTMVAEGGIGGTGISSGPINGFGSIFVNGVKFDTSDAEIFIDGNSASEDELQVGMTVTVYGEIDENNRSNGSATKIEFHYLLQGNVTNKNLNEASLIVSGHTVMTDELTVFSNADLDTLKVNDEIAISGSINANNEIVASYITTIQGEELSETAASAAIDSDTIVLVSSSTGDVGSSTANTPSSDSSTTNQTISIEGEYHTLTGFISERLSNDRFVMRGNELQTTANTVFVGGNETDLVPNARITVKASVQNNAVTAEQIDFLQPANVHIAAAIDTINGDSITLAGIDANINPSTLMLDRSSANIRRFSSRNLGVGDKLIVYGSQSSTGIQLSRLERRDALNATVIQGSVNAVINQSRYEVLGITIDTSTAENFSDASGNTISSSAFFNALESGSVVYASGTLNGSQLTANSLRLR